MTIEKILLVEDNEKYRGVARQVITQKYKHLDIAETLEKALPMYKNYDFVLIDGFFPVAKEFGEKQRDFVSDFMQEVLRYENNMPFDYAVGVMQGKDNAPLGLYLADKMKNEGINNYLIVTAADHHTKEYGLFSSYTQKKNLNLFIEDLVGYVGGNSKDKKEYWKNALTKMEEITKSYSKSMKGGKENDN